MQLFGLKQYLFSPTCINCGSFFCNDSLFCQPCFKTEMVKRIQLPRRSHLSNTRHFFLLEWHKTDSQLISQMVYRLKSDNSEAAWYFYANLLLENTNIKFQNYKALIPIPSAKKNSVHANLFAKEISRITGLPVLDILSKKTGAIEQKRRSAFDRENEVTISLKTQQVELFTKYIFVDDILTTGQSFLQSNRVVNDSNQNIIITLFYRAKAQ